MKLGLPLILSPNLGCPVIISISDKGVGDGSLPVLIAHSSSPSKGQLSLWAKPSYNGEGTAFKLKLREMTELTDEGLPSEFENVDETRDLVSKAVRERIFSGSARFFRFRAQCASLRAERHLRTPGKYLPTLYNLVLVQDGHEICLAFHALCLRRADPRIKFLHVTDTHIALCNDLNAAALETTICLRPEEERCRTSYVNFNENLRRLIRYANELADQEELDFVLMLGDLIDFMHHGLADKKDHGDNNWRVFREIILGSGNEKKRLRPNYGLRVPLFTSTGNHDWKLYPYDISLTPKPFDISKAVAKKFDRFWADTQAEISRKRLDLYNKLIAEGSPVSNKTWFGCFANRVFLTIQKWQVQLAAPLSIYAISASLFEGRFAGTWLPKVPAHVLGVVLAFVVTTGITGILRRLMRKWVMRAAGIEAGWPALKDYFLTINPYFNYAFSVEDNYFLILDTGHDCLTAQTFWDDGDKKLGPVSVLDNTIGMSPDTMAFYGRNEYYPYSQIEWIERLQTLIGKRQHGCIIIGLHSPPANLSGREHNRAKSMAEKRAEPVLMKKKPNVVLRAVEFLEWFFLRKPIESFNIRYGTINHYLSQFYHLCLGRREGKPGEPLPRADLVLAGHAHWKMEFSLRWEDDNPVLYYGDFTGNPSKNRLDCEWPLLLQTPAAGPCETGYFAPPYFRKIVIEPGRKISEGGAMRLFVARDHSGHARLKAKLP